MVPSVRKWLLIRRSSASYRSEQFLSQQPTSLDDSKRLKVKKTQASSTDATSRHVTLTCCNTWRSLHLCLWSLWKSCSFGDKVVKCKKLVCASSCFLAEALKRKKEKKSKTLFPDSFSRKILKQINPGQILSTFISAPQRERGKRNQTSWFFFFFYRKYSVQLSYDR